MTAATTTPRSTEEQIARGKRRARIRFYAIRTLIYLVLGGFALAMIFPFLFMFTSSLKTPADTFRYPPRVLPREQVTTEVAGEEVGLFAFEVNGETREFVLAESGVQSGIFVDPADPETEFAVPLAQATDTGTTTTLDGEEVGVYSIPVGSGTQELALKRNTVLGRFVAVDDAGIEAFANVRNAPPVEELSARWSNYSDVLDLRNIGRSLTNTVLVTAVVVVGILFTSIMGGYAFARLPFPGRTALFLGYLGSIMVPFMVLLIPLFQLMVTLGWIDSLAALTFPFIFNAYGTFLMRQFFVSIPTELDEAALIDGASRWRILWGIYVPLSFPAIATLATFSFLYAWNSFIWPLIAINPGNTEDQVLTLALRVLGGQGVDAPNLIFAGIALAVVVPMTVFVLAQRYFVENVATSGIK